MTVVVDVSSSFAICMSFPTLIFANVLQGKGQASIFPLDNSDLSKSTLSDNPQEPKVIEIHYKDVNMVGNGTGLMGRIAIAITLVCYM